MSAGSLDPTFDLDGIVVDDYGQIETTQASVIQADGKIVVGATQGQNFLIARYNTDGSRDSTFGTSGAFSLDITGSGEVLGDLSIDTDGRIVVAGTANSGSDLTVVRLTPLGALDTSFDLDGIATVGLASKSFDGSSVAIESDGQIVVGATAFPAPFAGSTTADFSLARFNSDGSLDTGFGTDGFAFTDFELLEDRLSDIALQPNGQIVAVGTIAPGGVPSDVGVVRYNTNGSLDTAFDGDGKATIDVAAGSQDFAGSVAIQGDGKIVVSGRTGTLDDMFLARLKIDGLPDSGFAGVAPPTSTVGTVRIDFGTTGSFPTERGEALALEPTPDGKILLGGSLSNQGGPGRFGLARVLADGTLDSTFGNGGKADTAFPNVSSSDVRLMSLGYDLNGKIVAAGWVSPDGGDADVAIARFEGINLIAIDEGETATNSGVFSTSAANVVTITATLGTVTHNGNGAWSWSYLGEDDLVESVTITATYSDAGVSSETFDLIVSNVAPTGNDATFEITENRPADTFVGAVLATDPAGANDPLSYAILSGNESGAFTIDSQTGQISVLAGTVLDFEATPSFNLEINVSDDDGGVDVATIAINLLNQASIVGVVYVDVNQDGMFDASEPGIDGVTVELLDANGNAVLDGDDNAITAVTSDGGMYLFEDLDPGSYQLFEQQPTGVDDGEEMLGTLGGAIVANDTLELTLVRDDAFDYAFAELGQQVASGDTAGIGFWQNKHGRELITAGGTALANWLTNTMPNVFGDALAGASGSDVADFYRTEIFKQKGKKSAGPAKIDAEFMSVALATYFTSQTLAGTVGAGFGFNVTDTGIGTKIVNVGDSGAAFNVADGTDLTILQLLHATDSLTDQFDDVAGFAKTYDTDGNGVIDAGEAALRVMASDVFKSIG